MTTQLSANTLKEFKEFFTYFDANGDGSVDMSEVEALMRKIGRPVIKEELTKIFAEVDSNGDGSISFEEFVAMLSKSSGSEEEEERDLREAFNTYDLDSNGKITASELKQVLTRLGEKVTDEDVKDMIRSADMDEDDEIDFDEFKAMMTKRDD